MEKVQWNSIDKKPNRLKYSKNDESSTLPRPLHKYYNQSKGIINIQEYVTEIVEFENGANVILQR